MQLFDDMEEEILVWTMEDTRRVWWMCLCGPDGAGAMVLVYE